MKQVRLTTQGIILIASKFLNAIVTLAVGIVLVRVLTKEDYGTYLQIMLITGMISGISMLGIPKSIYYFVPRVKHLKRKKVLVNTLALLLVFGMFSCFLSFLLREHISDWMNNTALSQLFTIFCAYIMFKMLNECVDPTFLSLGKAEFCAMVNIVSVLGFAICTIPPLLFGFGLKGLLYGILIFYSVQSLFLLIYITKLPGSLDNVCRLKDLKIKLSYSLPLGMSAIVGMLGKSIDKLIISYWFLPAQFAVYARGAFELPFVGILPYTISNLLIPKYVALYAQNRKEDLLQLWHESIRKIALVIFPIFIFTFIIAEELITLLFTDQYIESVLIFRIYLFMLLIRITVYGGILQAIGDTKSIFKGTTFSLFLNIMLSFLLFKIIGFAGPAVATVISEITLAIYFLIKIKNKLSLSFIKVLPWYHIKNILLASLLSGIVIFLIPHLVTTKIKVLIVSGLIYFPFFSLTAWKFGIINHHDKQLVLSWLSLMKDRIKYIYT